MNHSMNGSLILFPNLLDENSSHELFLPPIVMQEIATIDGLIAESEKAGRVYLRRFVFKDQKTFRDIPIRLFNEHTRDHEITELLYPMLDGQKWGLISDCGLPCLADPGAKLVFRAHQCGLPVKVFPGPSAIVYALMLSGLSAQSFAFQGYLPRDNFELIQKISLLEKLSRKDRITQIFIEAPYRNQKLLENLLNTLHDTTLLSVAWDLTLPSQQVISKSLKDWRSDATIKIDKKPAVFLFSVQP